jgi:hypothetical protein
MQSDFEKFFHEAEKKWKGKPVLFVSEDIQLKGVLEDIRIHDQISSHQRKSIEARVAMLAVRVPGEKPKSWELDRTLWQLQCDFDRPEARLEMTPLGNVFFKSGTITGLIVLTNNDEQLPADPSIP